MVGCASNLVCGVLVVLLVALLGYAVWVGGREAFANEDCPTKSFIDHQVLRRSQKDKRILSEEEFVQDGIDLIKHNQDDSILKEMEHHKNCTLSAHYAQNVTGSSALVSKVITKHTPTEDIKAFLREAYNEHSNVNFNACQKGSRYMGTDSVAQCRRDGTTNVRKSRRLSQSKPKPRESNQNEDDDRYTESSPSAEAPEAPGELVMENDPTLPVFKVLGSNNQPVGKLPKCYSDYEKAVPEEMAKGGEDAFLCKDQSVCMDNDMVRVLGGFLHLEGKALVREINRRCGNNDVPVMG